MEKCKVFFIYSAIYYKIFLNFKILITENTNNFFFKVYNAWIILFDELSLMHQINL